MSNILGNGIGSIILKYSSGAPFFIAMGSIMIIVAIAYNFIKIPKREDIPKEEPKTICEEASGAVRMIPEKRYRYIVP